MRIFTLTLSLILFIFIAPLYAEEATKPVFTLNTNAFLDAGILPVLYTCDGKNVSPQFDWVNTPEKTQAFAMILADPEAPKSPFYHWLVYNIPQNETALAQGITQYSAGTLIGKNDFGKTSYGGPCPPKGSAHSYVFTIYALDNKLTIPAGADAKTVMDAMKNHVLAKTQLTAVYSRWINA